MNNLRKLREEKDIKQSVVADFLGISQQGYSKIEKNITNANGQTLTKLAEYFNVSVDYLLGLIDSPIPLKREKNSTPPRDEHSISLKKSDRDALKRTSDLLQEILKK